MEGMRGRIDITTLSGAFLAGSITGGILAEAPCPALFIICITLAVCLAILASSSRSPALFIVVFILLGIISSQTGGAGASHSTGKAEMMKSSLSEELRALTGSGFEKEGGLLAAIAAGDRSYVDKSLKNDFKASGAMHLIAISGLHVGVLYFFLNATFFFLGKRKLGGIMRKLLVTALLWVYAVITGLSSSILRAVLMITVYEAGEMMGSRRNLLRALAISAFITTLFNPDAPFQIGFQLSYGAMAAIHLIFPRINGLLKCRSSILQKIWDTVSLSISCQLFTAPLVWLYFGTFPRYFMITNLLAIPLTSFCIYLTPVALITRNLPVAGDLSMWLLSLTLHLMCSIIHVIAGL